MTSLLAEKISLRAFKRNPASFRDPSGFVFEQNGIIYRHLQPSYQKEYECLTESGLYEKLVSSGMLLPHKEVDPAISPGAWKVLQPERIPFISYPYEWCFEQLQQAALLTLKIGRTALEHGMVLRDASAFNVQFSGSRPVFMDIQSFGIYEEGEPWIAYRQFCRHFAAPLCLAHYCDRRLTHLWRGYLDGIPLDLASRLLPRKTRLDFPALLHIHLHAWSEKKHEAGNGVRRKGQFSKTAFMGLLDQLETAVSKWRGKREKTEWGNYYSNHNYSEEAFAAKKKIIEKALDQIRPSSVWDLGANSGQFTRLASSRGIPSVAFDIDPEAVSAAFQTASSGKDRCLLPLQMDLTNPSPGLGWGHLERQTLAGRGPADLVLALALVHHLAISNNVPLEMIAEWLSRISRNLVIEFVPKSDSQTQKLLSSRQDIFENYTRDHFEKNFSRYFNLEEQQAIVGSERVIYLFKNKENRWRTNYDPY